GSARPWPGRHGPELLGGGDWAGGSRELAERINRFGSELAADLRLYYGIDIREIFSDETDLTPGYLLSLIEHLPPESAYVAARRGGPGSREWPVTHAMLADLFAVTAVGNYMSQRVNLEGKPDPPEPYPRPGEQQNTHKKINMSAPVIAEAKVAKAKQAQEKA